MKRMWVALAWIALAIAADRAIEPAFAPLRLESPLQDKNFYLFSAIERTPEARAAVKNDRALARIAAGRLSAMDAAAKSCGLNSGCYAEAFRWSDAQSVEAAGALAALYEKSAALRNLADGPLRTSGMYVRYNAVTGPEFLAKAFADCARGVNHAIDVYGLGKAPRYPAIDSITHEADSDAYKRVVQGLVAVMEDDRAALDLFYSAPLRFGVELMLLNQRDEAGRYEPMETGENAAAFARIKSIEWNRYPYSVIVVPGAGGDRPGIRLSPGGKLRDEIAAKRFREGKAPFLLVSGGHVHPARTEYAEAIEMKRDLVTRLGVPADAIIVDPHARHTTTNMRNAARLMYRYGVPFEKKALVATDASQSAYIENPNFSKRCMDELGYVPYRLLGRISVFDLEFLPLIESLQADPMDPLDP
jgi:DUF218 domain